MKFGLDSVLNQGVSFMPNICVRDRFGSEVLKQIIFNIMSTYNVMYNIITYLITC